MRIRRAHARVERLRFLPRLRDRHAWCQPAEGRERSVLVVGGILRGVRIWPPQVRAVREREAFRRDAYNRIALARNADRLAHDVGSRAESALPEPVAHDDDVRGARSFVGFSEEPARSRDEAEHVEETGRDLEPEHALRLAAAGKIDFPPIEDGELVDALRVSPPLVEVRGRDRLLRVNRARRLLGEHHEPVDVQAGQRMQDERIDELKCGGVDAEAERQRQHNGRGHERLSDLRAHGARDFVTERGHWTISQKEKRPNGRAGVPDAITNAITHERKRLQPVPQMCDDPAAALDECRMLLAQIAGRDVGPDVVPDDPANQPFGEPGWRGLRGHLRSRSDSRPLERSARIARVARSASSPDEVTVK